MANDIWTGNGDWNTNPANWSLGVPTASSTAIIQSGTNTLSTSGTAKSLSLQPGGVLQLSNGATLSVTQALNNSYYTYINNNGNTVSIGSVLNNAGYLYIGRSDLSTSTTVTAASLYNNGEIDLNGNATAGSNKQATLNITGSNSGTVVGRFYITGNADLALANGLTAIAANAVLEVDGAQARVSLGTGAMNSGLSGLGSNAGLLNFRGNSGSGAGGVAVTTTTDLTNFANASFYVDAYGGDGGSTINIGGVLTNSGTVSIGNTSLSASTTVKATGLNNSYYVTLQGNAASGSTAQATLNITGAVGGALSGNVRVSGNADLILANSLTTLVSGSTLELDGSKARVSVGAGTTNTALSGLTTVNGSLFLRGNTSYGAGGVALSTNGNLTSTYNMYIDYYGGDGGSSLNIGGQLTNSGSLYVGNYAMSSSTTLTATGLNNTGYLVVQGNTTSGSGNQATVNITGASSATLRGNVLVGGNADLILTNGIEVIGNGGRLELDGSKARVSIGAGMTNSALSGLSTNSGTLIMRGNNNGSGGVTLTTTTDFTNNGTVYIDNYGSDGGSQVNFGGKLKNTSNFQIGNYALTGSVNVTATGLTNFGTLVLQGNTTSGTTNQASLNITGATSGTVTGSTRVSGDADLILTSGITSVGYGSTFELDGNQARASLGAGTTNSALSGLTSNAGTLLLRGNSNYGLGGVSLTTTKPFSNSGNLQIDYYGSDGASSMTVGGRIVNSGSIAIGNYNLSASTNVSATGFVNDGSLVLYGNVTSGSTNQATLTITGATSGTVSGSTILRGNADLALTTAIAFIDVGAFFELDGSAARASIGAGTTNSALTGLTSNAGTFLLRGNSNYGSGGSSVTTTKSLNNSGTLQVDYYGGDGASALNIGGVLTNTGTVQFGNYALSASTNVTATGLNNTGSLILQGNTTSGTSNQATLTISGATAGYTTGFNRISGNADLILANGIVGIGSGSTLELDGSQARVSVGAGANNSALSGLATNAGLFLLRGKSNYGAGGVTVTTTKSLSNTGTLWVDYYGGDGGSTLTLGGTFSNSGNAVIGNYAVSAATTVTVNALTNSGSLSIQGTSSNLADLVVNGTAKNTGNLNIGINTELDVAAGSTFYQQAGTMTVSGKLVAPAVIVSGGTLDFTTALASGDGVGSLTIKTGGILQFDSAVDNSHTVTFSGASAGTLKLNTAAASTFNGKISGFGGSDVIDIVNQTVTGLSYSGTATAGVLTVSGASGTIASLNFIGSYTTSSFSFISDGHSGTQILDPPPESSSSANRMSVAAAAPASHALLSMSDLHQSAASLFPSPFDAHSFASSADSHSLLESMFNQGSAALNQLPFQNENLGQVGSLAASHA